MKISPLTENAIKGLCYMASITDGYKITVSHVADGCDIERKRMAEALKLLVAAGIIKARAGMRGGVALALRPQEITLGAVYRVTSAHHQFMQRPDERLLSVMRGARNAFEKELSRYTIADLVEKAKEAA